MTSKVTKRLFETLITDVSAADANAQDAGDIEGVGVTREDERGNEYRWVKNAESAAFAAGDNVCYDASDINAASFMNEVQDPVSNDLMLYAGVAMGAIPALGFGWIQTLGYHTDVLVDTPGTTAIAVGSILIPENSVSALKYTIASLAGAPAACAVALEAVATATPATTGTGKIACYIKGL